MKPIEHIEVYIKTEHGNTVCICPKNRKRCSRNCPLDTVDRDRYRDWRKTMNNRYGK